MIAKSTYMNMRLAVLRNTTQAVCTFPLMINPPYTLSMIDSYVNLVKS